ncbi:MAG TPA: amino acid ABC transporter substrate-binding protein [Thermoleophilaceae bacterium]|jgi:branched-chain amino acid transport system substrate-binding protein|nr:amino acid ABC transporter substrate-binding protein [Thermoleophilaceae bacterium]
MKRAKVLLPAVLAVVALVVAACGGSNSGSGTSSSKSPIKVGASLPLTGDFSEPGKAAKQGYQVWQAIVNQKGGLIDGRKVQMVIKDDASNQNTIVADYNALISKDKVNLLLGTFSSLLNLPASAVAEKNQMLYVEPAGGSPDMFSRGFKYLFFAQQATADHQGDVFANYVKTLPAGQRPKTAAYPTLDDPFAQPTSQGIEKILKSAGIKTVYRKTYTIDQKNFDSIANAVKASGADLVVHGATFEDGVGLVRALLKIGYTPKMLYQTTAPSLGDQYAKAIGKGNTEGVFYAVSHSAKAKTPGNDEFVAKYKEMFGGTEVPEDAADAYAAAQVMQAAVKAVGGIDDQAKLADWLHKNKVDTILGPLSWDDQGRPQGKFLVGQWQSGAPEIVLPKDAATVDSPKPQWSPGGSGT